MSSSSTASSAIAVVTIFPVLAPAAVFGCMHFRVHIIDGFITNMLLHCWSKNDDLGNHTLWTNGDFNFRLRIPSWWGHATFQCDMKWGSNHKHVAVFTEGLKNSLVVLLGLVSGIFVGVDGKIYVKKLDWDN